MTTVLFACTHNAGRSQMAATLFNRMADPSKARAESAWTQPAATVHPVVAQAMAEKGVTVDATPRLLTPELASTATVLITMGCGDACPYVPGVEVQDWGLPDPKGQPIERVREIRDEIEHRVTELLRSRGLLRT